MTSKELNYLYTKTRKNFGRQTMFSEVQASMLDSIAPDIVEQKKYCLQNPVNHEVQVSVPQKEHYINTTTVNLMDTGVNHVEGGWPKDIPFDDEELTSRYRRRFERDDSYVNTVLNSYQKFEHIIDQNNAIEMYEVFFKDIPPTEPVEKLSLQLRNVFKDLVHRPIGCLNWTLEDQPKLIVVHCNKKYPTTEPVNKKLSCYIWDLEIPKKPAFKFRPPTACWQAVSSPLNPSVVVGGLADGRVCVFDIRNQLEPVHLSPMHLAHRDPVTALLYMQTRLNTDFFSGSTDGRCMWWDIRNISEPTDLLIMSVRAPPGEKVSLDNAEGVTSLQYEKAFPAKFLCGTDTGLVINVNRKAKSLKEMMSAVVKAHFGPVKAVHRSRCTSKMFLTCGDWTAHIWSEDVISSPIVTGTSQRYQINDVAWVPQRISSYLTVSVDGVLRYWDFLRKYREPSLSLQVSKHALLKIKPHEQSQFIAVGDEKGKVYILSLSETMVVSGSQDKSLMLQTYDRETRREHILEARIKEIRVKQTTEEKAVGPPDVTDEEVLFKNTEEEFKRIVSEELRRREFPNSWGSRISSMKKR